MIIQPQQESFLIHFVCGEQEQYIYIVLIYLRVSDWSLSVRAQCKLRTPHRRSQRNTAERGNDDFENLMKFVPIGNILFLLERSL